MAVLVVRVNNAVRTFPALAQPPLRDPGATILARFVGVLLATVAQLPCGLVLLAGGAPVWSWGGARYASITRRGATRTLARTLKPVTQLHMLTRHTTYNT